MDVVEYVARGLARQAGEPEDEWQKHEPRAREAVETMRRATPEVLANIARMCS
jgi:hypothetical protein